MSFYRRLNGFNGGSSVPVNTAPGAIPRQTAVNPIVAASPVTFPPTPKEVLAFRPTNIQQAIFPPQFHYPPPIPMMQPVNKQPASVTGAVPIEDHPAVRKSAQSDDRAAKAAAAAKYAQDEANAAVYDAKKAASKADADPYAAKLADQKASDAARAQIDADAAAQAAAAADAKAQADAIAAQKAIDQSNMYTPKDDGGSMPYDPGEQYADGLLAPPPGTLDPTLDPSGYGNSGVSGLLKQHPYVATGGGAAAGFVVGGPLGAIVGAAIGFFTSRS